ncbi:DUF837 domain-containing protein [Phormidium tenue]|uniref:Protein kinase n=1 Tax=Phormidium tenue NIES-30 TaxID=549789 RepID=A0A1U7J5D4_9CYAN|nr:DUF837 domain-containing protein [Phormidium tenue]MBD2232515.1 DUF837 domain-containing protein [Phormidium tenue FACHB-1052]OKH48007.1 protein kinase [Phormidium tenue NIES-30]
MAKKYLRISEKDIDLIVSELDQWAEGQLGSKLTWALLEERFGFSRQALQAKPQIKAAYDIAKLALSSGLVKSRQQNDKDIDNLIQENRRLKAQIEEHQRKEYLWKQRWQRIAYHIREKGSHLSTIDQPIPPNKKVPNERETLVILRPFDNEIPPSGRI